MLEGKVWYNKKIVFGSIFLESVKISLVCNQPPTVPHAQSMFAFYRSNSFSNIPTIFVASTLKLKQEQESFHMFKFFGSILMQKSRIPVVY